MATKAAVIFDLEYNVNCPQCAALGLTSKLGLIAGEGIRCDGPQVHSFADLPSEPDEPAESPELAAKRRRELIVTAETTDAEPLSNANILPAEVGAESGEAISAAAVSPVVEKPADSVEVATVEPLKLWEVARIGGGDFACLIRLSEAHYQMLLAEAENQNQTFREYFSEWLIRAESNQWI